MLIVLNTIRIHIMVIHVLPAECTHEVELLELTPVSIDQLGPLVHFVPRFFVKLILEVVVLLLQLLRELVNDIIFELQQLPLFLVVVHEHAPLRQLPRQVVGKHVDVDLEMLRDRIFNVVIYLPILVQKLQLIRTEGLRRSCLLHARHHLALLILCVA